MPRPRFSLSGTYAACCVAAGFWFDIYSARFVGHPEKGFTCASIKSEVKRKTACVGVRNKLNYLKNALITIENYMASTIYFFRVVFY